MTPPLIVFDLDGTLIDTAPDLAATLNVILSREGIEPVPYHEARGAIGGGARPMIERALAARDKSLDPREIDRMFRDFIDHYADHIADRSQPFPGLVNALDSLAAQGFTLAVCTNKLEWLSRKLLDALRLSEKFAFICGQDTFAMKKPDPQVLHLTAERAGSDLRSAIMVGDSITDIRTARAAGIPVIAVDFGYTDIPVDRLDPDRVISHYDDLMGAVHDLTA